MAEYEIKCIKRNPRTASHMHITDVGGTNPDGKPWTLPVAGVLAWLANGDRAFTAVRGAPRAYIRGTPDPIRGPYIETIADSVTANNLVSLPDCPP